MFFGFSSMTAIDLGGFNTDNVTDMSYLFANCSSLKELDVSGFNTANVDSMFYMFSDCSALTELDLSGFDTQNVTEMRYMFYGCSSLAKLNVTSFDTTNVRSIRFTFDGCASLEDIGLGEKSLFTVNLPRNSWTRYMTLNGAAADGPTFGNLPDYDGSNPGWYKADDPCSAGHTPETIPGTAATCTRAGLTEGSRCSVCGKILKAQEVIPALGHSLVKVDAKAPTVTSESNIEHWSCTRCGRLFADEEGNTELIRADVIIPRLDKADISDAVVTFPGLSSTKAGMYWTVYTGTAQKPEAAVTLGSETLKKGTDYTIGYTNNKDVGTATVTVTGKGSYTGKAEAAFLICFKDVPATHNFQSAVCWAVGDGIAAGYSGDKTGIFGVSDYITRGQVVTFLYRLLAK